MHTGLFLLVLVLLTYYSVRRRAHVLTMRQAQADAGSVPFEPKPSPISKAILDIGGIGGGIYIAITALSAFLRLEIPPRLSVGGVAFDPVALVSLISAILWAVFQPAPQPVTHRSPRGRVGEQQGGEAGRVKSQVGAQIGCQITHGCGHRIGQVKG